MSRTIHIDAPVCQTAEIRITFPFWRSAVVLLVVALAAALLLSNGGVNAAGIPGVDMHLPDTIGNYLGFDSDVTAAEKTILPKDTEFAKKRYVGPADITCEIVLADRYRLSIHRPELCMTAQGWNIIEQQSYSVPVQGRSPQVVRVLTLSRTEAGRSFTSYYVYWFVGQNKATASHIERYFFSAWDRSLCRCSCSGPSRAMVYRKSTPASRTRDKAANASATPLHASSVPPANIRIGKDALLFLAECKSLISSAEKQTCNSLLILLLSRVNPLSN
jgi:hypothetical protein